MYDYGQMIASLGLTGLMPQTQIRLTMQLPATTVELPASPYWHVTEAGLQVTLPWQRRLRTATRMLTAVTTTLARAGVDVTLATQPFMIDWALPEALFEQAYPLVSTGDDAPSYVEFRNGWYLRFQQAWQRMQPQLQAQFGVTSGFALSMLGEDVARHGIAGMRWAQVPIMANTDTGSQTQNLVWLRAAVWGLLANTLPAQLGEWVQELDSYEETARVVPNFPAGARRQILTPDDGLHLPGYPQLSLDNQLLMAKALARGHRVDVLDEQAEVLRIDQHLITGAAALNDQAAVATSQVKPAVKRLLAEADLPTPVGEVYLSLRAALHDYHTSFATKAIVIKPAQDHHGRGVRAFMLPPLEGDFIKAFKAAAEFGPVLIEAFAKGSAYRFVVQDDQVLAVMEMVPANVVGDGHKTIAALVTHKNARRPLGWQPVVLDAVAEAVLARQGVNSETVLPRGYQIFLRNESNTDFGADGYDVTAELASGYKTLALKATRLLGLRRAGIDMMIANLYAPYDPTKTGQAEILSVTAAPVMWPHAVAQMGEKRDLAAALLDALL